MDRKNFVKLIGADSKTEYTPVAFLLKSGYAGLGHYNATVNEPFTDVCVLLNARLVNLDRASERGLPTIRDFNELLDEVIVKDSHPDEKRKSREPDFGTAIPIIAVPLSEFAVIYPVSQIQTLVARSKKERGSSISTFFDLSKSEILSLLRIKLW